jgi:hypothetical protein
VETLASRPTWKKNKAVDNHHGLVSRKMAGVED